MSKNIQLSIPKPCHENWDAMSPVEKGRFCGSCQKQVVDFSNMNDRQIAEFFKRPSTGSVCGRFMNDQLDRDIELPKKRIPWFRYFFSIALPASILSLKAGSTKAQIGKIKVEEIKRDTIKTPCRPTMGIIARPHQFENTKGKIIDGETNLPLQGVTITLKANNNIIKIVTNKVGAFVIENQPLSSEAQMEISFSGYVTRTITWQYFITNFGSTHTISLWPAIQKGDNAVTDVKAQQFLTGETVVVNNKIECKAVSGRVLNEEGLPVSNASILSSTPLNYIITDDDGVFSISSDKLPADELLSFSAPGFENAEVKIANDNKKGKELIVVLKTKLLPEVEVISSNKLDARNIVMGGLYIVNDYKKDNPSMKIIEAPLQTESRLKIFPNPIPQNASLNLDVKKMEEGYYHLQIINSEGRVYVQKELWIDDEAGLLNINLPTLSSGTYFVVLTSKKSAKKFTEKLIVE
ncbi:MAG TPA: carboxypeptidase-like regulatory domain-containing protein [Chitinophagaceae bacterium]|nr:carboxypeptidase-like regulatory domain-containing protein [Chitinophagaceae bacterium]